jgi:hypothetical protein
MCTSQRIQHASIRKTIRGMLYREVLVVVVYYENHQVYINKAREQN